MTVSTVSIDYYYQMHKLIKSIMDAIGTWLLSVQWNFSIANILGPVLSMDGFHGAWLHFWRARVGICVQCRAAMIYHMSLCHDIKSS